MNRSHDWNRKVFVPKKKLTTDKSNNQLFIFQLTTFNIPTYRVALWSGI